MAKKIAKHTNPVAKHARHFNKAAIHIDRKKALKRGHIKHKSQWPSPAVLLAA